MATTMGARSGRARSQYFFPVSQAQTQVLRSLKTVFPGFEVSVGAGLILEQLGLELGPMCRHQLYEFL